MKTAVILFNLGGPDDLKAVKPFLFNLFNDPSILSIKNPLRWFVAKLIATKRASKSRDIYSKMGGKSPILDQSQQQAKALEEKLQKKGDFKVFVSMRYWHPRSDAVVKNVANYAPDRVVLLPLYPQYSTTTTASSFAEWDKECAKIRFLPPTSKICCYPTEKNFVAAHAKLITEAYWKAAEHGKPRILFSAHGLPEKVIAEGDPYQFQIEKTVSSIVQILSVDELDYAVCYQSRVGSLKWIGPSTEEEISRAGRDRVPVVVVPVAFVSEHSETLVELDIEYRELAKEKHVPAYQRVAALSLDSYFIDALYDMVLSRDGSTGISSHTGERFCLRQFSGCPCKG